MTAEGGGGIGSGSGSGSGMVGQLELACATAHALLDRVRPDLPVGVVEAARRRREAIALLDRGELPIALFESGSERPWLTNQAWSALFGDGADLPAAVRARLDEVSRSERPLHIPEVSLDLRGAPAYCTATLWPVRGSLGAPAGVIVSCADVTDQVIAQQGHAQPDEIVWGGALAGTATYTSRRWRAYAGAATAWQSVIHPDDLARCKHAIAEVEHHRMAHDIDLRIRRVDGDTRWHRARFVLDAERAWWFASASDIHDIRIAQTERNELLARERASRTEAEHANRMKDQFLAAVSHELRAPLTTMLLWEKVLCEERADEALRAHALDAIHQSAVMQSRLVADLLDVSRAVSGKLYVDMRMIDPAQIVREALDACAPAAAARQLVLELRGTTLVGEVQGDRARLRQVLDNLLSNALKFTDPGGRITVSVSRKGRAIAIEVTDTGRGIAPEFLPRLFDPFTQTDDPITRRAGGLGLGLAIAKQLVELHHGTLTAASPGPGEGAKFTVTLPAAAAKRVPSPPAGTARLRPLDGVRILVLDDDPRVREALALLLERVGAAVAVAASPDNARARLASDPIDVLVCDIAMPGEDGYSFIRQLRAGGTRTRAIALTAHATQSDSRHALDAGFDVHLAKPIDLDRLVATIEQITPPRHASP